MTDSETSLRAGDQRRVLAAALHRHTGDVDGLADVLREAGDAERMLPMLVAAVDYLALVLSLNTPGRADSVRAEIASLAALEEGGGDEEDET